jgi:hypothetical protein
MFSFISGLNNLIIFCQNLASLGEFGTNISLPASTNNTIYLPAALGTFFTSNIPLSLIRYAGASLFLNNNSALTVVSDVLALELFGLASGQAFGTPVELGFWIPENSTNFKCAFYDFMHLTWDTPGCQYDATRSNSSYVLCQCTHLTNFAVLLDSQGAAQSLSATDSLVLGLITTIGCSISIALMGLLVAIFILFPVRSCRINISH